MHSSYQISSLVTQESAPLSPQTHAAHCFFPHSRLSFYIVTLYCAVVQDYPMKEVLSAAILVEDFQPEIINTILSKLTPDNMRVAIIGQKFSGQTDKTEKWYGTEYSLETLPQEKLDVSSLLPSNIFVRYFQMDFPDVLIPVAGLTVFC